jgi:hypothetical protein
MLRLFSWGAPSPAPCTEELYPTGPMYFVFFSLPYSPHAPSHHGSVWLLPVISLLLTNTVSSVRACRSIWWEMKSTYKTTYFWFLVLYNECNNQPAIYGMVNEQNLAVLQRLYAVLGNKARYKLLSFWWVRETFISFMVVASEKELP